MKLNFPDYALKCLNKITDSGFEAYFVGGCVRDGFLGKRCDDIDITTNALPDDIIKIFDKTIPTGIKHGTVTVIIDGKKIEVTTYRTESGYTDHRHPENINFVSSLKEDLSRRDFTMNALAYNGNNVVDLFGGIDDMNGKIIRAIGNPEVRFKEDALRIMRAYRFSCVLGFDIDYATICAAKKLYPLLNNISGERVFSELKKLSRGTSFKYFYDFLSSSSLSTFGIDTPKVDLKTFEELANITQDESVKFPLLVSLCSHNINIIKEKLKPDSNFINKLSFLETVVKEKIFPENKTELKQFLFKFGIENLKLLINYISLFDKTKANQNAFLLNEVLKNGEPFSVSHLKVNGNFLSSMGFSGEDIGKTLEKLVLIVIGNPNKNTEEFLKEYIKKEYHH